jgi:hypothetical protein
MTACLMLYMTWFSALILQHLKYSKSIHNHRQVTLIYDRKIDALKVIEWMLKRVE